MTLQVLYFAGAAAATGLEAETIARPATVAELKTVLGQRHPSLVPVLAAASLLVDGVACRDDSCELGQATQVDVLPPFAGG